MLKTNAGDVSAFALMGPERDTPTRLEETAQRDPKEADRPATGDEESTGRRSPHRHRQESAAYRRNSGGEPDEHDLLPDVFDERDVLLTRPEAAAYLRKSAATLERWARIGFGPKPVMAGRRALYRLSDLRKFTGPDGEAA